VVVIHWSEGYHITFFYWPEYIRVQTDDYLVIGKHIISLREIHVYHVAPQNLFTPRKINTMIALG